VIPLLLLAAGPAAAAAPAGEEPSAPQVEPGHDVERGPLGEGEQLRRWTALETAEIEALDPTYRHWVERIRAGFADKRIMRLYWFFRSRLDPFDRPVPAGWRAAGLAVLRDEARNRRLTAAFEEARRGDAVSPPTGAVAAAADLLRDGGTEDGALASGGISSHGVWVPVGPFNIPGRMTGLDGPRSDPDTLYAAAADGGVWRTRDGGSTWETLTDFEATLSGGSILLDPTDPDVIYFGTGEGNGAIDNYPGIGVLRSRDGGKTWAASNTFSSVVRALAMHRSDPDRIYAAGADGCYVSDDAGANFTRLEGGGLPDNGGASDVLVRPDDPDWVYCAIWGGSAPGIHRSTDGGQTWSQLTHGFPEAGGRISLAISRGHPEVLVAGTDVSAGRVYRTTDGGDTWTALEGDYEGYCGGQCWYDNVVGVDPADPEVIYAGGIHTWRSLNGGLTWSRISSSAGGHGTPNYVHVDQHDIFTPRAGEIILANDGGIYRSTNHGTNWTEWSQGMDTTQYYGICRHSTDPGWAFGGTQDNGSHRRRPGDQPEWQQVLGGDGGMCMSGRPGSNIIVGEYQNLNIQRSTNDGASFSSANGGIDGQEPHPWVGILVADPSDRDHMWTATSKVYRSLDGRQTSWVPVSWSLYYGRSVSALEVAPSDSNRVYVGYDYGGLYRSTDALAPSPGWTDVRDAGQMPMRSVRRLRAHPGDADMVYAVFAGYGSGRIWKSGDGGGSWTEVTGDLPDVPVNDLVIDGDHPDTLLAATDLGVFRTDDDGSTWYGFSPGLPTAASIEFTFDRTAGTLRLGTHGRSMWEWQPASDTPTAVPDGRNVPGSSMTVEKIGETQMRVHWDVRTCTAWDYNLFYGDLELVAGFDYAGAECGLGTSGRADLPLPATPSGSAYFLIAATDGQGGEGPHGHDGEGDLRPAHGVGLCELTTQVTGATCP
jgi:photosystem II stability/assembly factor-like uncharacterized protein